MKRSSLGTLLGLLVFVCSVIGVQAQTAPPTPPNPILYLAGLEAYSVKGNNFIRYRYGVLNASDYPAEMFVAAPSLPPCGTNANSSRTWVDLYDHRGKRLYGFCALKSGEKLNGIWFSVPEGEIPPSWIYIELHDRKTGTKYKSNLADTTL